MSNTSLHEPFEPDRTLAVSHAELRTVDVPLEKKGTAAQLMQAQRLARDHLDHPSTPRKSEISIDRDDVDSVLLASAQEEGGNHVLLYGPRGTGKTTTAARAAFIGANGKGQEVYSVTLTSEQSAASLWGHYIPKGNEFVWQDGPFLKAWRSGGLLIINEVDHASEDVRDMLHVLLDNPEVAKQSLPTGETAEPAKGFRCIATMNGYPTDLDEAVLDRFALTTLVDRPSTEMFASLPADIRQESEWQYAHIPNGADEPWLTFREMQMFAKLRSALDEKEAAQLVWGYDSERIDAVLHTIEQQRLHEIWEKAVSGNPSPYELAMTAWKTRRSEAEKEKQKEIAKIEATLHLPNAPVREPVVLPPRPEKDGLFGHALHDWEEACSKAQHAADAQYDNARLTWDSENRRLQDQVMVQKNEVADRYRRQQRTDQEPEEPREPRVQHAVDDEHKEPSAVPVPRDDLSTVLERSAHIGAGMHALFFGPPGTGKTTASYHAAAKNPDGSLQKVYVTTLTVGQSAASLWGHWIPKGDEFVWHDGPFLQAWRDGALLVISEIDQASEDVSNMLHVLLDNPEVAKVSLPNGETVRPKEGFRCIASMNGTIDDLAPAVLDRFAIVTPVLQPSTEMINALPDYLRPLARYVYSDKNNDKTPEGSPAISYRTLEDFARLSKELPEPFAASLATKGDVKRAQSMLEAAVAERTKITQQTVQPSDQPVAQSRLAHRAEVGLGV